MQVKFDCVLAVEADGRFAIGAGIALVKAGRQFSEGIGGVEYGIKTVAALVRPSQYLCTIGNIDSLIGSQPKA
jgi:hypothetical protein